MKVLHRRRLSDEECGKRNFEFSQRILSNMVTGASLGMIVMIVFYLHPFIPLSIALAALELFVSVLHLVMLYMFRPL